MAWLVCDKDGTEIACGSIPERFGNAWVSSFSQYCELPPGSIMQLIGRELTWDDDPVEI